jgi:hypothetical protein
MNTYCTELNLDIYPFIDNFDPFTLPNIPHQKLSVEKLNPQLIDIFKSLDIFISFIEVFIECAPCLNLIHIDHTGGDISKINWVFGGSDSYNQWYEIEPNLTNNNELRTNIDSKCILFSDNDVKKILHTHYPTKNKPFIFQSGIPHRVSVGNEKRCCVSMIPRWIRTLRRLTYQDALNTFSSFIVSDN